MSAALNDFFAEAAKQSKAVTIGMGSGHVFEQATVTNIQFGALELTQPATGRGRRRPRYVVALAHIEWAVLS